jgi:spore coat protein CotH
VVPGPLNKWLPKLGIVALLSSLLFAPGCGVATESPGLGDSGATTGVALAERYDDLFPDDRVQTVRVIMEEQDWEALLGDKLAEEFYRADIWIDDELVQDVAVRAKGNSSLRTVAMSGSDRVGLKVDLNFFNSARSYHGLKKLNYSNGFSDPTLMKEFLSYELMAAMGVPAPRACFVDLWVNDTHLGVYTQVEQVDAHFLAENFADSDGNLYKPELMAGTLDWTEEDVSGAAATEQAGSTTTSTTPSVNIGGGDLEEIISRLGDEAGWIPGRIDSAEQDRPAETAAGPGPGAGPAWGPAGMLGGSEYLTSVGLKTNEDSQNHSGLYELLEIINREPSETTTKDLESVLEVDEILRFLAVSVALVHLDNYIGMGHNYYLYEDGGRFSIIPWDLNMSFGGFNSGLSRAQIIDFFIDEPTAASLDQYPLVEQLMTEPEYLAMYRDYLRQLLEGPFSVESMTARIDEIASLIRPYVRADDNLFFSFEEFEQGLTEDLTSNAANARTPGGAFIGLVTFVEERTTSIAAQLSGEQAASKSDGSGNGGSKGPGGIGGPPLGGPMGPQPGGPPAGGPEGQAGGGSPRLPNDAGNAGG